tara:strand:+ start:69 stop:506 length:438 start_codon:yes stop_codon:yes gene_type:complete
MSYSVIKDYTNKQGKSHQAHFSPKGKYLGPVSKKGDKPFLLTKVKVVEPVVVEPVVVEPVVVDKVEPVVVKPIIFIANESYKPTEEYLKGSQNKCQIFKVLKRTEKCVFLQEDYMEYTQIFRKKLYLKDGVEFTEGPTIYANTKL